jgi:hypothetical protein
MPAYSEAKFRLGSLIDRFGGLFRPTSKHNTGREEKMVQSNEQVIEIVEEQETEIVELSLTDLEWVGGGQNIDSSY